MKKSLTILLLSIFSVQSFAEDKKISCPHYNHSTGEGRLEGGAWRIDSLIFNTDDMVCRDRSKARHIRKVHTEFENRRAVKAYDTSSVIYSTTPAHLTFHFEGDDYTIDRSTLKLVKPWGAVSQCSISDV
jgi:hypothetical protein